MEREHSNVGTFFFKYEEIPEAPKNPEQVERCRERESCGESGSEMRHQRVERNDSLARLHKTKLNYSQEDIHALASKAELLVLTGSNHDLRVASSDRTCIEEAEDDDRRQKGRSECFPDDADTPDLDIIDTNYEEPCLSGTWEHDIQEQYLSEGSALGTWDNSMKSVLCFGEDYSNYIRRKSELPSIDLISSNSEGLQGSPRDLTGEGVDPVLLLRMSERNWLNVLTELNTQDNLSAFGDPEHFQRLMKTCETNIETLSNTKISPEVVPQCLPQDHYDLLASWEDLVTELKERLSLCEKYSSVTAQIETATSKLEVLLKQRKKLETFEDGDIDLRKDSAQGLLHHLEILRRTFTETTESLQDMQTKISSDDKNVHRVSLLCVCRQEISQLVAQVQDNSEQITEIIRECEKCMKEKLYLDQELLVIDQHFNKSKWRRGKISPSPEIEDLNEEKVSFLKNLLCDLRSKHAVNKDYFEKSSKSLERVSRYLSKTEEAGPDSERAGGFLFSCLPVVVVTSAIMVCNYVSPLTFLGRFCRQNVYDN